MKNLNKISAGHYVILSPKELKNVTGGFNPNDWCAPHGETCNGSCIGTLGPGGQTGEPIKNGICKMVFENSISGLCTCVGENGAG